MAKVEFKYDDLNLRSSIPDFERKVDDAISKVIDYRAVHGVGHMKSNAPWTDRTGAARSGLHTVPSHQPRKHEILFSHGPVHYGIWLEIANSGRYQIIMPSVRFEGDELMKQLKGLFGKLEALT